MARDNPMRNDDFVMHNSHLVYARCGKCVLEIRLFPYRDQWSCGLLGARA